MPACWPNRHHPGTKAQNPQEGTIMNLLILAANGQIARIVEDRILNE